LIVPWAAGLASALATFQGIYGGNVEGDFTAYHVLSLDDSGKSEITEHI
jgi:hypothetical protein